ncbi:MAG: C25 family cysteine peptidase [Flavobacteriales bacterium]|nr:C25 family cysteine peptidase [Flavobacteriales bacterium]MDW8432372.1 C25 family cysteine peptidase [Flavobacteriales bacterium]
MPSPQRLSFLILCLMLFGFGGYFVNAQSLRGIRVVEDAPERLIIDIHLPHPDILEFETEKGKAVQLAVQGCAPYLKKGFPAVPWVAGSVELRGRIPRSLYVQRRSAWQEWKGTFVPSKGNLTRDIRPSQVPYSWGPVYQTNAWFPKKSGLEFETFRLGRHQGLRWRFSPVEVQPVKKKIRYAREWRLVVEFDVSGAKDEITEIHPSASKVFLNSGSARYTLVPENGDLLIIAAQPFRQAMIPWANWKNRRGIRTYLRDIGETGSTPQQIKNYIENFCQNHPVSHVLLVGDIQHIPSPEKWGGVSDITYGELAGNDAYPEVFLGRLSVESLSELETVLSRWMRYEQNPDLSNDWLAWTVGVASQEGPGDDNQLDFEHSRALMDVLTSYTYTQRAELFEGTQGAPDNPGDPTAQELLALLNLGTGFLNYTGHGWEQGIATTGFSNTEADQVVNNGRGGMAVIVGCVTGAFHTTTCIAEKLTRSGTSAAPHGLTAVFAATINQSWSPPMEAQDAIVDILTENESNNVVMRTLGGLFYTGCMRMNDVYGVYGDEMTETWILFGDPSMPYYTRTPDYMTASHPDSVAVGAASLTVYCSVEGALVCVSQNNEILGRAHVSSGQAVVALSGFQSLDSLDVVVSAFNYVPYQGRIAVVPPNGPFVLVQAWAVTDTLWGNANHLPEFGEPLHVRVQVANVGLQAADSVQVHLSINHPHAFVVNGSQWVGVLNSGQTALSDSALRIQVGPGIPDGTFVPFTLGCTWAGGASQTSGLFMAGAPVLHITQAALTQTSGNANGISESGEALQIFVQVENTGLATFTNAPVTLNLSHPSVGPASPLSFSQTLPSMQPASIQFSLQAAAGAGTDEQGLAQVTVGNSFYQAILHGGIHLNPTFDDFETGPFWTLPYAFSFLHPWMLKQDEAYDGQFSLGSSAIQDDQVSEVALSFEALVADTFSFFLKVSCENGYDFLKVFLDDIQKQQWTGEVDWTRYALPVTAGLHTVRWRYEKDYMISAGADAAWIDRIVLPKKSGSVALPPQEAPVPSLWPNPARETVVLVQPNGGRLSQISLWTTDGRLARAYPFSASADQMQLSLMGLPPGMYFVKGWTTEGQPFNLPLVVLN